MTAGALACGCSAPAPPRAQAPAAPGGADAGYAAPPEPRAAAPAAEGGVSLSGVGRPDALVRLASPDGSAIGATASNSGAWSLALPAAPELRLYSVSEDVGGRPLRARGYLAVWSAPQAGAAMLRPGAGAELLGAHDGLSISALDFDLSGAAVASGSARPNQAVSLSLDGADAGDDRADSGGRFALSLPHALTPGPHRLTARAGGAAAEVAFEAAPPAALPRTPYAAAREGRAWRIVWTTPGGGPQTTLLFDQAGAAR